MRHHRELFDRVRAAPGMYFERETFEALSSFIQGYDLAYEGGLLLGFREWLAVRLKFGFNLAWPALVLSAAFPDVGDPARIVSMNQDNEKKAIDAMFSLIYEFDEIRKTAEGLRSIFLEYEKCAPIKR